MILPIERNEVRNLVALAFRQNGAIGFRESDMVESALFDGGKCVAWTYRLRGLMAMWLIDVGLVQLYDADGDMLQTFTLSEQVEPRRMAA